MKRKAIILCAAVAALCMASCHKTCVCYRYDGGTDEYSADEVDRRGTTCDNMILQAGQQYYAVCNWD